jgi:beta-phosphoglucomutase family hydrolase
MDSSRLERQSNNLTSMESVDWSRYAAVLFDLDGVITPTAIVHMAAWSELFNGYLAEHHPEQRPYTAADYFAHVDGKPRYDGVRDFLLSRGISLPEGTSEDPGTTLTVRGLGNHKNDAFNAVLARDGVEPYAGSILLLDHLRGVGVPLGVVSSSANARNVLEAAGLLDRFDTIVDGNVADELELDGKPAPDTFLHAAQALGASAADTVVLEDAVSGVAAGAAGHFGLVVGVDRGAGQTALMNAGADIVVSDLSHLVPGGEL